MRTTILRCGAVVVMAALSVTGIGCNDEDDLAFSTKVTNKNLCNEVAEVMCNNMFECCQGDELEAEFGVEITTSEEACRRDMQLECERQTAVLQYAMEKKSATLLTDAVDACLEAFIVGPDGCFPHVSEFAPECDAVMVKGNRASGADCLYSFECVANNYCGPDRKCKALPGSGENCESEGVCAAGLYCGLNEDSTAYVCQAQKGAGEDCSTAYDECQDGTICLPNADGTATVCTALQALGQNCDSHAACESGYCLPGTCSDGTVCESDAQCGGTCETSGASCGTDADCGGVCETSGASCIDSTDCQGVCSVSGYTCYGNDYCDYGTCSNSGYTCYDVPDINYCDTTDTTDVCVQADVCVSSDVCVASDVCTGASTCGGRVCAENYGVMDLCHMTPITAVSGDAPVTVNPL